MESKLIYSNKIPEEYHDALKQAKIHTNVFLKIIDDIECHIKELSDT